jgi:hypothetical protein
MRSVRPAAGDLLLQAFEERPIVDRHKPDHHGGKIRVLRQERAHRLDEQVGAFLPPHPAEYADAILSRQARLCKGRAPVAGRPMT